MCKICFSLQNSYTIDPLVTSTPAHAFWEESECKVLTGVFSGIFFLSIPPLGSAFPELAASGLWEWRPFDPSPNVPVGLQIGPVGL